MFTLVNAVYERFVFLPLAEDVIRLSDGSSKPMSITFRIVLVMKDCAPTSHLINRLIAQQVRNTDQNTLKVDGAAIKSNNMNQTVLASAK